MTDAELRTRTLHFLLGEWPWPLTSILPMKRWHADRDVGRSVGHFEVGYVRLGDSLTIFTEGATRERRYASAEDVVNDGWRAD